MKIWWLINIVWLIIFAAGAIFIGVRKVDAVEVVQTPEIKMISFVILGIVFSIVVLIQFIQLLIIYFINKKTAQ